MYIRLFLSQAPPVSDQFCGLPWLVNDINPERLPSDSRCSLDAADGGEDAGWMSFP